MNFLKAFAIIALASVIDAQLQQECEDFTFNMAGIQKKVMECAMQDFTFIMQMSEMRSKDVSTRADFFCQKTSNITDILECLINKVSACAPPMMKAGMAVIPDRDHILNAMNYLCEDKSVMMNQCMADNIIPLTQCYQQKITQIVSSFASSTPENNVATVVCKVVHEEEECIKQLQGNCSDDYIERLTGILDRLFPCGATESKQDRAKETKEDSKLSNRLLASILIHGQPQGGNLKYRPYNVVNV